MKPFERTLRELVIAPDQVIGLSGQTLLDIATLVAAAREAEEADNPFLSRQLTEIRAALNVLDRQSDRQPVEDEP